MLVLAYDGATLDEGKLDQVGRWRSGLFARICSSFGLDPVEVSFHLGPIGQIPPSERHIRGPHDDELLA
jgi:hypothetical protein